MRELISLICFKHTLGSDDGGLRTARPTSRWARACPARVGLLVLKQPRSIVLRALM